jgi:hypothetical protein
VSTTFGKTAKQCAAARLRPWGWGCISIRSASSLGRKSSAHAAPALGALRKSALPDLLPSGLAFPSWALHRSAPRLEPRGGNGRSVGVTIATFNSCDFVGPTRLAKSMPTSRSA